MVFFNSIIYILDQRKKAIENGVKTRKFDISVAALVWLNFKGLSVSLGERWVQGGKKSHCTGQGGLFLKCKSSHIQSSTIFFCPTTFTFFKAGKYVLR